jgi:hypothetical protein
MKDGNQIKIKYKEVQKFTSPVLWIFLSLFLITFLAIISFTLYNNYTLSGSIIDDTSFTDYVIMIISLLIIISFMYLFAVMKLEIIIDDQYLYFTYNPFLSRRYPLKEIIGFTERKFRPLIEYRGWGIRYSLFGHGMAYTVKGNTGVQFLTRSGKKFLLGTQKPGEMIYYLNKYINSDERNEHNS